MVSDIFVLAGFCSIEQRKILMTKSKQAEWEGEMTHKTKLKLARKMRTKTEVKAHTSPFLSKAWGERRAAIENRVQRKIKYQQDLKELKNAA